MKEVRLLRADEIECRIGTVNKARKAVTMLLYKDARVDMAILDETFGAGNWQRSHEVIGGELYCNIDIWCDDKKTWVRKQDVGTESMTEKEKGRASDSFKRAGFNVGIGRELYTAPFIWIELDDKEFNNGKPFLKLSVSKITYKDRVIDGLELVDRFGNVKFTNLKGGRVGKPKAEPKKEQPMTNEVRGAIVEINDQTTQGGLMEIYNKYPKLQKDSNFITALSNAKKRLPK